MKFKPALLRFKFDNFASLPSGVDAQSVSDIQTDCNGHKWRLQLYPGGQTSASEPGWISLYLCSGSVNNESLDTKYTFFVRDAKNEGNVTKLELLGAKFVDQTQGKGRRQFLRRSEILD